WKSWSSRPRGSIFAFRHFALSASIVRQSVVAASIMGYSVNWVRMHDRAEGRTTAAAEFVPMFLYTNVACFGSTRYKTVALTFAPPPSDPSTATESSVLPFAPSPTLDVMG